MKLYFLLLSLLFCCIKTVYADSSPCERFKTDYDKSYCLSKFLSASDKALNESYQHLRNCLKKDEQKALLKTVQLKWLAFREFFCSDNKPAAMTQCAYNLNIKRTQFLQDRDRECEAGYIDEEKFFSIKNKLPELIPLIEAKYALKSDSNQYLAVCNNCTYRVKYPNSAAIHVDSPDNYFAQWNVMKVDKNNFILKDGYGKLLARSPDDPRGVVLVYATDTTNPNAQWQIHPLKNGKIALSDGTGHYLCRCERCYSAAYPNIADTHCTNPEDAWAQWTPTLLRNES